MPAQGDHRMVDILEAALTENPRDVLQLLRILRSKAPALLGRHEGRVHALLHRLVHKDQLHVVGVGSNGLAQYATWAAGGAQGVPPARDTLPPLEGPHVRRARSIASGVRAPDERVRVEADVQAHLAELAANGRESSFGAARNARHLLRRVDRSKPVVLFPSGTSDHVRKFIVEEGPWIVTAILAFLLIRAFLAEVFYIPSSSMVPTLLEGDRVVVTKPGACGRMPERWSIVTFDHQGTTFVKRVIGLGGEKVLLLGGDPYIDGELLVRPRDLRDDLRASYRTWDLAPPSPEWRAADDGDARVLEYAGPTLWSGGYDQAGHPFFPGDVPLRDVYATLDAERDAGGRIGLELAYVSPRDGSVSTTLVLDAADTGTRLTVEAPDGRRKVIVLSEEGRAGRIRLELAYVDGEVVVRGPGGEASAWLDAELGPRRGDIVRPRIRSTKGARALRFALDKDHYYTMVGDRAVPDLRGDEAPESYAHTIPERTVFLLGDNSYSSNDGRFRKVGDVSIDDLIGPVVFRIWPPSRIGIPR